MAPRSAAWKTESGSMNRRRLRSRTVARLMVALVISAAAGYGASTLSSSSAVPIVLRYPTELAVRPKGNLYIGDTGLDQILERLASGSFQVIAGDGRQGFSGDGGSAADAELNSIGDMTFARNGVLYFADGNRIRAISPAGLISTVVGDGSSSRDVANDTPALQASVGYPSGLTIGPDGDLYFTSGSSYQVLRLTTRGTIEVVASSREFTNLGGFLQLHPAELAFDGSGDLYVSTGNAFRLVELTRSGRVLYLGDFRRGGGSPGALASGPAGSVFGDWQNSIVRIEGSRVEDFLSFARGTAPRVSGTFSPYDIAVGRNGTIYSDTIANDGWTDTTALIAISPDRRVTTLWARNEPPGYESR